MAVVAQPTTTTNTKNPDASINTDAGNCLHVISVRTDGRNGFATHLTKMNAASSNRQEKIATDKIAADKKLTTARANAKKQFEDKIAKLLTKTGLTDVQKQAIETYKTDMELAKTNREFAVDKARADYRSALSAAILEQQTALSNAAITYQESFEKAFAVATADCAKVTDMSTVKTAIQTAKKDFKASIDKIKISDKIKQLASTRDSAIQAANETFAKQASSFTETLKTALGE